MVSDSQRSVSTGPGGPGPREPSAGSGGRKAGVRAGDAQDPVGAGPREEMAASSVSVRTRVAGKGTCKRCYRHHGLIAIKGRPGVGRKRLWGPARSAQLSRAWLISLSNEASTEIQPFRLFSF